VSQLQPLPDCGQVRLRVLECRTRATPAERRRHPAAAPILFRRIHSKRTRGSGHIDVVRLRIHRHIREDADNRMRPIVHLDDAADNTTIAAKRALPVLVTEHQCRLGVVLTMAVVVGAEHPSDERRDPERLEVVPRDDGCGHSLGLLAAEQDEVHVVVLDHGVER
jgi:hypothetical protein